MTEEEAKTKWCPQSRLGSSKSGLGGFNRFAPPETRDDFEGTRCLGSACMAWRRNTATFLKDRKTGVFVREAKPGDMYTGLDLVAYEGWTDTGFCGLAGRP